MLGKWLRSVELSAQRLLKPQPLFQSRDQNTRRSKQRSFASTSKGHAIKDTNDDSELPDAKSWEELEAYLKGHDAVEGTIEEAKYIWELYEADTHGQAG